MVLQVLSAIYDEINNETRVILEDRTEKNTNTIQEMVVGNVENKPPQELIELAMNVHYARYYADKAVDEFLLKLQEKEEQLSDLISKTGVVHARLEELGKLNELSVAAVGEISLLFLNSGLLQVNNRGETVLNPAIVKIIQK